MSESSDATAAVVTRGGTRFRRSALLFLPAMLGVLLLTLGTLFGVIPLNLYLSGQDFKLSSNGGPLVATGLKLNADNVQMKFDGKTFRVSDASIQHADLKKGLCISLTLKLPVVGTWTLTIKTDGDTEANDLTLGAVDLSAGMSTLRGTNANPVNLGVIKTSDGQFGVTAPSATLQKVVATGKSAKILGTVDLRGIGIPRLHRGSKGSCF